MCLYPRMLNVKRKGKDVRETVQVACGNCVECLSKRAREWSFRIVDESNLYKDNCFITLTYDKAHYPQDGNVNKRDIQLFLKRLRKKIAPQKIRYFYCGEYGEKRGRPHYHMIIFGWLPSDIYKFFIDDDGVVHYRSKMIEDLWQNGYILITKDITLETALYSASYMQKLNVSDNKQGTAKQFVQMSNRPGIGARAFDEKSLVTDKLVIAGKSINLPRYYLKLAEADGWNLTEFHDRRMQIAEIADMNSLQELNKRRAKAFDFINKKITKKS